MADMEAGTTVSCPREHRANIIMLVAQKSVSEAVIDVACCAGVQSRIVLSEFCECM